MTLGLAPRQADLFSCTAAFCDQRVAPDSIYGILHRECLRLFPDEMFADLFDEVGRRSVPPMIVAVGMVLQRVEGWSDREAGDRVAFDLRGKYAARGLDFDYPGVVPTVLAGHERPPRRPPPPDRRLWAAGCAGWAGSGPGAGTGRGAAGHGDRPGPWAGHRRRVQDRPAGRPRPGHLHRRPRRSARPQDLRPRLRWLQGLMPISALALQCRASCNAA